MTRGLSLLSLLLASTAFALPADWVHDVEPGREKFVKLPALDWVEVEDPKIATAEWLADSNELLLSGLKPGRTHLLLGAQGKVAVWRLRVGGKPVLEPAAEAAAKKACPDFTADPSAEVKLTVTIKDEACRKALTALFQTDAYEARALELTFAGVVLQAQLRSLQEGLARLTKDRVKARYVGAGLVLEGKATQAEHRKLLWELYRRMLGRFALDDRVELDAPPDAGAARP